MDKITKQDKIMESIKHTLLNNWHFIRWVRLILGVIISIHAIQSRDVMLGVVATFILFQAISNTGCCGATVCDIPNVKKKQ